MEPIGSKTDPGPDLGDGVADLVGWFREGRALPTVEGTVVSED